MSTFIDQKCADLKDSLHLPIADDVVLKYVAVVYDLVIQYLRISLTELHRLDCEAFEQMIGDTDQWAHNHRPHEKPTSPLCRACVRKDALEDVLEKLSQYKGDK